MLSHFKLHTFVILLTMTSFCRNHFYFDFLLLRYYHLFAILENLIRFLFSRISIDNQTHQKLNGTIINPSSFLYCFIALTYQPLSFYLSVSLESNNEGLNYCPYIPSLEFHHKISLLSSSVFTYRRL